MTVSRRTFLGLVGLNVACSTKTDGDERPMERDKPTSPATADAALAPAASPFAHLGPLTDLIVAEAADLPRADFDPGALVTMIGSEPEKLFDWVRDRTYWRPYRGLLRGAQGVMLDRTGSSLDRAVLLGDLLRRAGHSVRLAHAEIQEAQARELLGKVRPVPAQRRAPTAPKEMPAERRRAIAALMPDFEKEIESAVAESRRITAEAQALVRSQSEVLLAAVSEVASPDPSSDEIAALAALRDHWWVERKDGEKWIAMDVLLPEAKVGETLIEAARVNEWRAVDAAPPIPEDHWHAVQVRVVVERYEAGETKESKVLEVLLRPAEVLERQITLGHMPVPWLGELSDKADPTKLKEAALAVREWVPHLRVGSDRITQSAFSIDGDISTNPADVLANVNKVGGADVVGGMDMALGGFGGDEVVPALTAEWLDYEIRVPGAVPERLRRPVFDLLGPARRASKAADFDGMADLRKLERFEALWGETDILLQPSEFTADFVTHLALAEVVANQGALREIAKETDPVKVRSRAAEILELVSFWGPLPELALWRTSLAGPQAHGYLDRPNVLNYRVSRAIVNVEPMFRQLIDIASNPIGARRDSGRSPFETRLRQGVADTVAEMVALGSDLRMAENTASIFAQLASERSRGLVIPAQDMAAVRALPWPEDEAMRVGSDVESGFMAVVPRKAVVLAGQQRVGWWRVHPKSGETIGVMDTGFHQMAENALQRALTILRANRGWMRTVVHNPNSFPRATVQLCRRALRALADAERHGL
jgi:hypothetical protein